MMHESLGDAERAAMNLLNKELDDHLKLTEAAFNLICEAVGRVPEKSVREVSQSLKVSVAVLNRLSNDLRTASVLALLGYPTQAAGLVASLYESAFTIACIGADEGTAEQWIEHDDPTRPFRGAHTLTLDGLRTLGVPESEKHAGRMYLTYRQLFMAKHANPLYQMRLGLQAVGGNFLAYNGPDTSDQAIRAAWFALEHAVGLSLVAVKSFISNHLPNDLGDDLTARGISLEKDRAALNGRAKARWGAEDPFPGKWRV